MKILVTGATGNVGLETVKFLLQQKSDAMEIIAAVPRPDDAKKTLPPNTPVVKFDFADAHSVGAALQNINTLFLLRPPQLADVKTFLFPAIDQAKRQGVGHIVFLSLQGAQFNIFAPHHKVERYLKKVGVPFTFLRPSFFMQNLSTTHRFDIQKNNQLLLPAGNGKTSFIDVRDIAAVAAKTLLEGTPHFDKGYELTGSEALTYFQICDVLSKVLGRTITYKPSSIKAFKAHLLANGFEQEFADVMTSIYLVSRFGLASRVTNETATLLGRPPIGFEQFARDFKSVWAVPT
jgi:uncharacterized protein YbjT (DUF2867 family)